jgi:hypothetical protein
MGFSHEMPWFALLSVAQLSLSLSLSLSCGTTKKYCLQGKIKQRWTTKDFFCSSLCDLEKSSSLQKAIDQLFYGGSRSSAVLCRGIHACMDLPTHFCLERQALFMARFFF